VASHARHSCNTCNLSFTSETERDHHELFDHTATYDQMFTQMQSQTGSDYFKCTLCGVYFPTAQALEAHKLTFHQSVSGTNICFIILLFFNMQNIFQCYFSTQSAGATHMYDLQNKV